MTLPPNIKDNSDKGTWLCNTCSRSALRSGLCEMTRCLFEKDRMK